MKGFSVGVGLITGFMVGLEFPAEEGRLLIVDLGIIRIFIEWFSEEE